MMSDAQSRKPGPGPGGLTRRAVLAGGAGLVLGACGASGAHVGDRVRRGPAATEPPALPAPTVPPDPAAQLTSVPVQPVAERTRPAFYVHDVLPDAPPNAIALTIDDGPDPLYTPEVLALLADNGVKASFSVIGRQARLHPQLVRDVLAGGHGITNHSLTHPEPFATLGEAALRREVVGGLEAIWTATGRVATTFRSPGGDWSPPVFGLLAELGMTPVDWDVDPRDWAEPGTAFITSRLLAARPGDILLCHDGGGDRAETVAALRTVLPVLKERGLHFVTL